MKNAEVHNNPLDVSRKAIYDKRVQVANLGLEKRLHNRIFLIVR